MNKIWKDIGWVEFLRWSASKVPAGEMESSNSEVLIKFHDGSSAIIKSNYDQGWSEYTPGTGIEPPTVKIHEPEQ
jgi:hypothetical protein